MGHDGYRELLFGDIPVLRADRMQCPVCGHPTGDCAGEAGKPTHIVLYGDVPSMEEGTDFLVEEDVVVERQITPFTVAKVIVAHKGQHIPLSKARELGLF